VKTLDDSEKTLEQHAADWDALAADQERFAVNGVALIPEVAKNKAAIYRRTAEALRIEARTGVAVCACCHKTADQRRNTRP